MMASSSIREARIENVTAIVDMIRAGRKEGYFILELFPWRNKGKALGNMLLRIDQKAIKFWFVRLEAQS